MWQQQTNKQKQNTKKGKTGDDYRLLEEQDSHEYKTIKNQRTTCGTCVESFKFLGTTIANTLKIDGASVQKPWQRKPISTCSFSASWRSLESTSLCWLSSTGLQSLEVCVNHLSTSVWYGSVGVHNKNMLEGIVEIKDHWLKTSLVESVYITFTLHKATPTVSDSTHPANHLFEYLPSGKRFRSIKTRTTRCSNSFYPKVVWTKSPNTTPTVY